MEESTTNGEIVEAVVKAGGCRFTEVKVSGLKPNGNGLSTAWIRCPVTAANKIIENEGLKIGWVKVKATVLRARPVQCYRCMQFGHVRQYCREKKDNQDRCYRCGQRGHKAAKCEAKTPKCFACEKRGRRSDHRMGGPICGEANARGWRMPVRRRRLEEQNESKGNNNDTRKDKETEMDIDEEEEIKPKRRKMKRNELEEEEDGKDGEGEERVGDNREREENINYNIIKNDGEEESQIKTRTN